MTKKNYENPVMKVIKLERSNSLLAGSEGENNPGDPTPVPGEGD